MALEQSHIDALRNAAVAQGRLFVGGGWVDAQNTHRLDAISPLNGAVITQIAEAGVADVDVAVAAARRAFDSGKWSKAAPSERKRIMFKIADLIDKHALELAVLGVRDNGTEISMAFKAEPGSAAGTFRYYAEAIDKIPGEIAPTADNVLGLVHREAVGVVALEFSLDDWGVETCTCFGCWKFGGFEASGAGFVVVVAVGRNLR